MNLVAAPLGGVPMCRGAAGIAGHVRFGARTGGALVILGALLLVSALFFADSAATVFRLFPVPVLGVILFFGHRAGGRPQRRDTWRDFCFTMQQSEESYASNPCASGESLRKANLEPRAREPVRQLWGKFLTLLRCRRRS